MGLARVLALGGAVSAGALLLGLPAAGGAPSNNIGVDTTLISRSTAGGLPNGPSGRPVLSLDSRRASVLAFESTATDLVAEPTGGGSNVYFARRARPYSDTGSEWVPGTIEVASQGLGGQPADGPSALPAIGADNKRAPGCIAFISAADNLVARDTNGRPDAFAFFPDTGKTIRVSVTTKGHQARGAATAVAVNSRCTQFAFADDASNLTRHAPAGVSQIYLRYYGGK